FDPEKQVSVRMDNSGLVIVDSWRARVNVSAKIHSAGRTTPEAIAKQIQVIHSQRQVSAGDLDRWLMTLNDAVGAHNARLYAEEHESRKSGTEMITLDADEVEIDYGYGLNRVKIWFDLVDTQPADALSEWVSKFLDEVHQLTGTSGQR